MWGKGEHMDIKKYEVFLNTLNKGSFARACEELGYSQPAITHMMKSMEREIGVPLLKRSNRGIQLTNEGEEVLPLIRQLVKLNDQLNQKYDLLRGLETGKVRVGTFPTVACSWLPRILRVFEKRYPNIQIELLEENSLVCLEKWLSAGFVDLCFIGRQPYHTFKWFDLAEDPYCAVLPEGHPLAAYQRVPISEFENQPFLMCKTKDGLDADISNYFKSNNAQIHLKMSSNSDLTIVYMVREKLGVSILPRLMLDTIFEDGHRGIELRELDPPTTRQLGIAVHSAEDISPAMERFIKCACEVISGQEDRS